MSLPSSSRFPLPHPSSDLYTAADLIAAQAQLEEEAAEAVPFSFSHCTYPDGPLRQPLYACRTCLGDAAVCAACSVSCHGEHDLVELFVRREFTCDCGTERMGAGSCCSLRVGEGRDDGEDMERNEGNKVGRTGKDGRVRKGTVGMLMSTLFGMWDGGSTTRTLSASFAGATRARHTTPRPRREPTYPATFPQDAS